MRNFSANRKTIFTFSKHDIDGLPDGMTIDADGNLWVAVFNSSRVIKIDPRKPETLLETIKLPAKQVMEVLFKKLYDFLNNRNFNKFLLKKYSQIEYHN